MSESSIVHIHEGKRHWAFTGHGREECSFCYKLRTQPVAPAAIEKK